MDSSNVLAELDPREVLAIAVWLSNIDQVPMTWNGFRCDAKFHVANLLN
jgi:hypothetical protein